MPMTMKFKYRLPNGILLRGEGNLIGQANNEYLGDVYKLDTSIGQVSIPKQSCSHS